MFGLGNKRSNNRGRVRNDTFGPSRIRSAMLAGAGMLAWRWWKNRQAGGTQQTANRDQLFNKDQSFNRDQSLNREQSFSGSTTGGTDAF